MLALARFDNGKSSSSSEKCTTTESLRLSDTAAAFAFVASADVGDKVVAAGGCGGGFGLGGSGMYFGRTGFLAITLVETLCKVSGFLPCTKFRKELKKAFTGFASVTGLLFSLALGITVAGAW
jgi:hypothetical protein